MFNSRSFNTLLTYAHNLGLEIKFEKGSDFRCNPLKGEITLGVVLQDERQGKVSYKDALPVIFAHEIGHCLARFRGLNHFDEELAWDIALELLVELIGDVPDCFDFLRQSGIDSYIEAYGFGSERQMRLKFKCLFEEQMSVYKFNQALESVDALTQKIESNLDKVTRRIAATERQLDLPARMAELVTCL